MLKIERICDICGDSEIEGIGNVLAIASVDDRPPVATLAAHFSGYSSKVRIEHLCKKCENTALDKACEVLAEIYKKNTVST